MLSCLLIAALFSSYVNNNISMSKFAKGNDFKLFNFFENFHQVIDSLSSISWPSLKT